MKYCLFSSGIQGLQVDHLEDKLIVRKGVECDDYLNQHGDSGKEIKLFLVEFWR